MREEQMYKAAATSLVEGIRRDSRQHHLSAAYCHVPNRVGASLDGVGDGTTPHLNLGTLVGGPSNLTVAGPHLQRISQPKEVKLHLE